MRPRLLLPCVFCCLSDRVVRLAAAALSPAASVCVAHCRLSVLRCGASGPSCALAPSFRTALALPTAAQRREQRAGRPTRLHSQRRTTRDRSAADPHVTMQRTRGVLAAAHCADAHSRARSDRRSAARSDSTARGRSPHHSAHIAMYSNSCTVTRHSRSRTRTRSPLPSRTHASWPPLLHRRPLDCCQTSSSRERRERVRRHRHKQRQRQHRGSNNARGSDAMQ